MRTLFAALMAAAIAATPTAAPAAGTIPDWVREAPGREAFPEEDGLLVRRHLRFALDATGRVTRREETAVKMLQDWVSRHGLLDPRIDWNDARAEMRVVEARTYMADGTVVEARENSLVPNTAPPLEWAVSYSHMRQMVVAHVGAEHGSTSVLAYEVADRGPSGVPLWGVVDLARELPVLDDRIEIETVAVDLAFDAVTERSPVLVVLRLVEGVAVPAEDLVVGHKMKLLAVGKKPVEIEDDPLGGGEEAFQNRELIQGSAPGVRWGSSGG